MKLMPYINCTMQILMWMCEGQSVAQRWMAMAIPMNSKIANAHAAAVAMGAPTLSASADRQLSQRKHAPGQQIDRQDTTANGVVDSQLQHRLVDGEVRRADESAMKSNNPAATMIDVKANTMTSAANAMALQT